MVNSYGVSNKPARKTRQLNILVTAAFFKEVQAAAEGQSMGIGEFVRASLRMVIARPGQTQSFKELPIKAKRERSIEDTLTWMLSRTPTVGDLCSREGHQLDARVSRQIRKVIQKELVSERIIKYLQGESFETQALSEGVTRQAVFISIQKGLKKLSSDAKLLALLTEICTPTERSFWDEIEG